VSHAVRLRRKGVRPGLRAGARAAHFAAFLARDLRRRTGVRVCRWRRGGGKFWPQLKEVAELVGLHEHLHDLLAAVRAAGIQVCRPAPPLAAWRPRARTCSRPFLCLPPDSRAPAG
jgi:hypothetical protein